MSSKKRFTPYLLLTTVSSAKEGKKIASVLVQKKIAACVNILPNVHSIFCWKGKVEHAKELLLVIKTKKSNLRKVEQTIRSCHSYDVPEMIGWPIAWGHKPYLDWLFDSVGGGF